MTAITNNQDVCLDMMYEGCCIKSLGLYKILDDICNTTGYSPKRIHIKVWNLKETHPEYNVVRKAAMRWHDLVRNKISKFVKQLPDSQVKHFGHFVGHGNRFRLLIGSHLWHHHKDKTLQTYHCTPANDYHKEFVALEDILYYNHGYDAFKIAAEFLQNTPMSFGDIKKYPIKGNEATDILDAYNHIFVDIVPQSYYSGNVFQLDEKFWRVVATKTPFLVQGPQGFIKSIQQLGFKTFSNWWDEGYSEDPVDYQVHELLENIDLIARWNHEKIIQTYQEMQPILDHNYQRFLEIKESDFKLIQ